MAFEERVKKASYQFMNMPSLPKGYTHWFTRAYTTSSSGASRPEELNMLEIVMRAVEIEWGAGYRYFIVESHENDDRYGPRTEKKLYEPYFPSTASPEWPGPISLEKACEMLREQGVTGNYRTVTLVGNAGPNAKFGDIEAHSVSWDFAMVDGSTGRVWVKNPGAH